MRSNRSAVDTIPHGYEGTSYFICSKLTFKMVNEWLADHLGHTLGMHKTHYWLQEPVVSMARQSRLLIEVEDGRPSEFVYKKLEDINPNGEFEACHIRIADNLYLCHLQYDLDINFT
jgi:hypothetical protein